jgi:hypothetical protein
LHLIVFPHLDFLLRFLKQAQSMDRAIYNAMAAASGPDGKTSSPFSKGVAELEAAGLFLEHKVNDSERLMSLVGSHVT